MSNASPLGFSYIRFSSADQRGGDSLRRQTERTAQWCEANGIRLVEEYRDLGVSAYRGKHRAEGALKTFLGRVEDGTIPKGSFLIVESLDRLSREQVMTALRLLMDVVDAGVSVVTLIDGKVYAPPCNEADLMFSIMSFSRAHQENVHREQRTRAAWDAKRRRLEPGGEILTSRCPAWLRPRADRKGFAKIPERCKVVRRIFKLAGDGNGKHAITRRLNKDRVPPFGRAPMWYTSYVSKILANRSVIGEFTPHVTVDGERIPQDPIPNYFPVVVPADLFHRVQQMRAARPNYSGRNSESNVFSKIAHDLMTGESIVYVNKGRDQGYHYLVPSSATMGKRKYSSWQYDAFKTLFLQACEEASQVTTTIRSRESAELDVKRAELAQAETVAERLVDALENGGQIDSVLGRLRKREQDIADLKEEIADLESVTEASQVRLDKIKWTDTPQLRLNLRRTVRSVVMDCDLKVFWVEFFNGARKFQSDAVRGVSGRWSSKVCHDGDSGAWVEPERIAEGLQRKAIAKLDPCEKVRWIRWQFHESTMAAMGMDHAEYCDAFGIEFRSPTDWDRIGPGSRMSADEFNAKWNAEAEPAA